MSIVSTRRMASLLATAALAVACACAGAGGARGGAGAGGAGGGAKRQSFSIPGQGALELSVPAGWEAHDSAQDANTPRTIELAPAGRPFVVLVSPVQNPEENPGREGADTAQVLVELSRRKAAETAVEAEIPLMELVGEGGVHGFWFAVTDKAMAGKEPKAGEFRHLLQGAAAVGPLIVAFTLLDNAPGPQRTQILDVVRSARFVRGAAPGGSGVGGEPGPPPEHGEEPLPGGGNGGFEPDPSADTVPLVVEDPGRRVSVLVDLPGFKMFKPRAAEDGRGVVVLGEHPETGIVASVIIRDAPGLDARGCRDDALARIREATPGLTDVRTSEGGEFARASYELSELHGRKLRQQHAHAFAARGGVCVNLHLSKAEPSGEDAGRFEQILGSLRFGEAL